MHQNYQFPTIDPSLLDLRAYPNTTCCPSSTASASDDVAIVAGQANYDDIGDSDMQAGCSSYNDLVVIRDSETLADSHIEFEGSGSLHNAPVEPSDTATSSSEPWSHYASLPPTRENGRESDLQTSAPGVSLTPGMYYGNSQGYQTHLQMTVSPLDTNVTATPSLGSYDSFQASPMHERMLRESQSFVNSLGNSPFCELDNVSHELCNTSRSNDLKADSTFKATGRRQEEWENLNFSSNLRQDESPGTLTSSSIAPIAIPRRRNLTSPPHISVSSVAEHALPTYVPQSQNGKSWRKMQFKDRDIEVSMELLRQENQDLITERIESNHSIASASCALPDQDVRHVDHGCISNSSYTAIGPSTTDQSAMANLNQEPVAAVTRPQSSKFHQPFQASSFPPTAGHFPISVSTFPRQQNKPVFLSVSGAVVSPASSTSLPMRRRSSKHCPSRRPRSGSLTAVPEYNPVEPRFVPTVPIRGRRRGRLPPATASAAGQKRSDGTVCIRCKMFKQTCEGDLPCEGCQKNSNARSWAQPCHKAKFVDLVEVETCNRVFQRSASVRSIGGTQRAILSYPGSFDVDGLMDQISSRQSLYNIGVGHFSGSWYTLSLTKLVGVMSTLKKVNDRSSFSLDDFGNPNFSKAADWLQCMTYHEPSDNLLRRSIKLNNMPSRNTYSYLPINGTPPRLMNVDDDKSDILLAVHLCRIVVRMLEVHAFKFLQKIINDLPKKRFSDGEVKELLQDLIGLLCSLRWRLSWWAVFQVGSSTDNDSCDTYTERVTMLTHTLYFWYFVIKKRFPDQPRSEFSLHYANGNQGVYDDFPHDESTEGFQLWLARGRSLVSQAYEKSLLS